MAEPKRKFLPLSKIKANQQNPRIISESKLKKLINSLLVFPKMMSLRPITIDENNFVLGGNMRQTALNRIAQWTLDELQQYMEATPEFNELPDGGYEALEFWEKFLEKPQVEVQYATDLTDEERKQLMEDAGLYAIVNPLGEWTGGTSVDCGATNRKLGSDMGDAVTGGGLHGKDLSKADVSVNVACHIKAQAAGCEVVASTAIGDDKVVFRYDDGHIEKVKFEDVVEQARLFILTQYGSFEKFAEWGLLA